MVEIAHSTGNRELRPQRLGHAQCASALRWKLLLQLQPMLPPMTPPPPPPLRHHAHCRRPKSLSIERILNSDNDPDADTFLLCYSSHGSSDGGKWCCDDASYVTFEDVVRLWQVGSRS